MKTRKIFLSYRRDDSPGYVSKLDDELERVFGHDRVFRDVTDIKGGSKWKQALEENLENSAVVLLVIGRRWESIWEARKDSEEVNYVSSELCRARDLDIPIIPVTLDGATLSKNIDLGEMAWILDNQTYDISDKQGRWATDFNGLVRLLEDIDGVGKARTSHTDKPSAIKRYSWLAVAVFAIVAMVTLIPDTSDNGDYQQVEAPQRSVTQQPATTAQPTVVTPQSIRKQPPKKPPTSTVPNIAGTWQGLDGTLYFVEQYSNGRFSVKSPGYADGEGEFIANMPRKLRVEMQGVGYGEFAVSTSGDQIIGWMLVDGQQEFDTLTRLQ